MRLIITDPAGFANSISWVSRHLASRPTIAILAGMRIHATTDGVKLAVFDYDTAAISDPTPGVDVDEEGLAVVPAQLLAQLATSLRPTSITTDGSGLHLAAGKATKARLPLMDPSSLPELPTIPDLTVEVVGSDLASSVQSLAPMVANPIAWSAGAGLRFDSAGRELVLTASDKYRIGRHTLDAAGELPVGRTAPVAPLLAAVKGWTNEEAYLGADDGGITVQQQERITSIRCIAEEYPNMDRAFKSEVREELVIASSVLRDAAKQASTVASAVDLDVTADEVVVTAANAGAKGARRADWQTSLPCEATATASLRLNISYLLHAIDASDAGSLTLAYQTGARPIHFNPDATRTTVVMGMRQE